MSDELQRLRQRVNALEGRVEALETGAAPEVLASIYNKPVGVSVLNAFALQRICIDGVVLGYACLQHPDQAVRTAAGEILSMLEACGYPEIGEITAEMQGDEVLMEAHRRLNPPEA